MELAQVELAPVVAQTVRTTTAAATHGLEEDTATIALRAQDAT